MINHRQSFIQSLFTALEDKDYILLKSIEKNATKIDESSDIDIWWNDKNGNFLVDYARRQPEVKKVSTHQQSFLNQLFIFFNDGGFLQVDCLYQLIRKDLVYLPNDYLKTQQVTKNGIKTYTDFCLFEHLVLFNQLNFSGIPSKYIFYFEDLAPTALTFILLQFNKKYQTDILDLSLHASFQPDLRKKITEHINKLEANCFFTKQSARLRYGMDTLNNLKAQRGFLVSFSGVDGAGKSTILEETRQLLSKKFRKKTVVIRHRPSLLPILSSFIYGKKQAENRSASRLPRTGKNTSQLNSLFRFSYYFADYLFGRSYIFCKYQLRNYIVLYDRYYFDFIVDSKRTNLTMNKGLPKWLYRFVQKPIMNFFLFAPADIILQRKQELEPKAIKTLTDGYQRLFTEFGNQYQQKYYSIENIEKDKTLNFISTQLVQAMQHD